MVGYKIAGVPSVFNNAETMGNEDILKESVTNLSSGSVLSAKWVGLTQFSSVSEASRPAVAHNGNAQVVSPPVAHNGDLPSVSGGSLRVTQVVQFGYSQRFFRNTITLENVGGTALDSVRYMRNVDPDQDHDLHLDYYTNNEIVDQQPADGKALVRATGLESGVSIFYFSADPRARVSTFGFTNRDPYDVAAYEQAGVYDYNTDSYISAKGSIVEDQAISICADLGTIQPGGKQTFVYYTSLDADFQDAIDQIQNEAQYVIHASAGPGGTIDPSGEIPVFEGETPSFAITATPPNVIASVTVDGQAISVPGLSSMTYKFAQVMSNHTIRAEFRSPDVMAPVIELPDGVPQSAVGSPYDLHLVVTDDASIADVGVFENGVRVGGSSTGGDTHVRLTLSDGRHELVIVALDGAGNRTERAITLVVDTRPPVLTIDPPSSVSTATLTLTGSAVDAVSGLASLTINGDPVVPFLDGSFSVKLALVKGANAFVIEAADRAGNTTSQSFTVTYTSPSSSAPSSIYVVLTIGSADMEVNGMTRKMDAAPFIKDGRTLLPIRALIEALGGSVQWNASTKTATVLLGSRTVALTIGSKTAVVDGKPVTLDVAPMVVGGRTFLPLRAVAENLGLDLAWEPVSQTISLTYWP